MNYRNTGTIQLILLTAVLLFSSCSNKPEFEQYHKFANRSWNRFNFVTFEYPVTDTGQEYDIYFVLRFLPEYPEKKFRFVFTIYKPSGEMRSSEHKLWIIGENGKMQGEEKGDFIELKIPVSEEISFPETGTAKFEIENKMTKLETPGIVAAGIIIEKSREEEY
jgi:gliding motility-associated lipoprotein GldH